MLYLTNVHNNFAWANAWFNIPLKYIKHTRLNRLERTCHAINRKSNVLVENLFCKYFVYGEQRKDIKSGQKQKQNVSRPDR